MNSGDLNDELENGITEVSDKNRVNLGCIILGEKSWLHNIVCKTDGYAHCVVHCSMCRIM